VLAQLLHKQDFLAAVLFELSFDLQRGVDLVLHVLVDGVQGAVGLPLGAVVGAQLPLDAI